MHGTEIAKVSVDLDSTTDYREIMQHRLGLLRSSIVVWLASLVLAACGDGGGGGGNPANGGQADTPPPAAGGGANRPPSSSNAIPTISGQPATTVLVGQTYSFQPAASDADGDSLAFTVTGLPEWATFNASTGRISGTPSAADVGTYEVTITVSDGKATASLGPFTITVAQVASGAATLSWLPPTENTDGSALTNLAGYEVRYGRDRNNLSNSVRIDDPSVTVYVIENLTSGTWYFAVAAINSQGIASELSNIASTTIA